MSARAARAPARRRHAAPARRLRAYAARRRVRRRAGGNGRCRARHRQPARRSARTAARRPEGAVRLQSLRMPSASTTCSTPFGAAAASSGRRGSGRSGRRRGSPRVDFRRGRRRRRSALPERAATAPDGARRRRPRPRARRFGHEALARKDFARLTGEASAPRRMRSPNGSPGRCARALRAASARAGGALAHRPARHHPPSVARGGEPIDLKFRRRKPKPLRLVALLDASGSMELYASFFTRFLHAIAQTFRQSEAYLFHTRLAHVSRRCRARPTARARQAVVDGAGRRRRHQDRRLPCRVQPPPCQARRCIRAPA